MYDGPKGGVDRKSAPYLFLGQTTSLCETCLGLVPAKIVEEGALALPEVPTSVVIERPRSKEHGDYATNVAMKLAKPAGLSPRDLAGLLATKLSADAGIDRVDIAGPGFNGRGPYGHVPSGGTGHSVATLVELATELARSEG